MSTASKHSITPWSLAEAEQREIHKKIISFFSTNRQEEIGLIASQEILDFFLETIGPVVYRKGIQDARAMYERHLEVFNEDLAVVLEETKNT